MKLYENIRKRRSELNMSQAELAEKTGYTDRTSIAKIESGKIDLSQSKIMAFAKALHVTPGELMGLDDGSNAEHTILARRLVRIPVYGEIVAGVPIEAQENILGSEEIPEDWLRGEQRYIALKVKGDSMYPKYLDGDTVIVRLQEDCESGQDAACYVNGFNATLKTIKKTETTITLVPINTNYSPTTYSHPGEVTLLGVVVELRRKI